MLHVWRRVPPSVYQGFDLRLVEFDNLLLLPVVAGGQDDE